MVYKSLIRPVVEFGLNVLAPMLKVHEIRAIERFQRQSFSIMLGKDGYWQNLEKYGVDGMASRIIKLFDKFASEARNKSALMGLIKRESKPLRKQPGFQMTPALTQRTRETPLNSIRLANPLFTPGRIKPRNRLPRLEILCHDQHF
jgi:hypothetical protein